MGAAFLFDGPPIDPRLGLAHVVGMARPSDPHSFWSKGIITVDTEMEEWGPPRHVECDLDLPPTYQQVQLVRGETRETLCVERFAFRSVPTGETVPDLIARWRVRDASGAAFELEYASARGWALRGGQDTRSIDGDTCTTFGVPRQDG